MILRTFILPLALSALLGASVANAGFPSFKPVTNSAQKKKTTHTILNGQVIKTTDGDTIQVESGGAKIKVRLYGVDAPETEKKNRKTNKINKPGQPFGEKSWALLEQKVGGRTVQLEILNIDRYRRNVAIVRVGNRDINREMIAEGAAWAYKQYLERPYASEYLSSEKQARRERKGLWQQVNPQPPWDFRKKLRITGG